MTNTALALEQDSSDLQQSPPNGEAVRNFSTHGTPHNDGAATLSHNTAHGTRMTTQQPRPSATDPFGDLCKKVRATPDIFSKRPILSPRPLYQSQLQSQPVQAYLSGHHSPAQPTPRPKVSPLLQDRSNAHHQHYLHDHYLLPRKFEGNTFGVQIGDRFNEAASSGRDYDQKKMKTLEQMFAAMGVAPNTASTADTDLKTPGPVPVHSRFPLSPPTSYATPITSPPRMEIRESCPLESDSQVRLTLQVYNCMLQDRDKLQAEVDQLKKAQEHGARENAAPAQTSNILGLPVDMVPRATMELEIQQKDQIIQHLRTSAVDGAPTWTNSKIKALESELAQARSAKATSNLEAETKLGRVIGQKDLEIASLQHKLSSMEQNMQSITGDRDRLAHEQRHADSFAKNRQDIVDALALKEKKNNDLRSELEIERAQSTHLTQQLQEAYKR